MNQYHKLIFPLFIMLCGLNALAQQSPKLNFGIKTSLNYNTIGSTYSRYNGSGMYSLGLFAEKSVPTALHMPNISISVEPSYTAIGLRELQIDNRYRYHYLDLPVLFNFDFSKEEVFKWSLGVRPAYLLGYSSEVLENGNFTKRTVDANKNKNGQIDFAAQIGVNIRVSQVVSIEANYQYSLNNNTDNSQVKGRPSLLEFGIKLNAVDLKNALEDKEEAIKNTIKGYRRGSLLVMLPTYTVKDLAKYDLQGDRAFAVNELRLRNLRVMSEFKKHYTFTPVYFFYDTSAYRVAAGDLNNIFLNEDLEITTAKPIDTLNFFVASFCNDISTYTQRVGYGLFIYDNKLIQLGRPFNIPSQMFGLYTDGDPANYFRTRKLNYTNMPFDRMVRKFNNRMIRYATIDE